VDVGDHRDTLHAGSLIIDKRDFNR
jgi:hypothetical protein